MPKTKISEFSATPANNTDIDSINIAEGCAPSGINDAIRELMSQLKDFQTGAVGDSFNGPVNGTLGATTPATASVTTLAASGAVTLSGGTANGVTYLNGSKVLTSGSALQFNGSQFGVNTTPSQAIDVVTDGASSVIRSTAYRAADGQAGINLRFARGSVASPTIVLNGDTIGTMEFYPYNGTNFNLQTALISAKVTGTVTTSNIPTSLVFSLDAAGSAFSNEQMRLTSTGLGIGTSSPVEKLHISNGASTCQIRIAGQSRNMYLGQDATGAIIYSDGAVPMLFYTNATERARIDSSGNLLINSTSTLDAVFSVTARSGVTACSLRVATNGDYGYTFKNASNTFVGAIGVNSSSTSYVTSSDYRLKNTIAPMTGALAKVALLKPVTYKWNVDGSDSQGFIAHELAEVVPECVTGEKDAVDADGNPKYQGIDTSFLVATLTCAIQEQQALIQSLKARLDAANL